MHRQTRFFESGRGSDRSDPRGPRPQSATVSNASRAKAKTSSSFVGQPYATADPEERRKLVAAFIRTTIQGPTALAKVRRDSAFEPFNVAPPKRKEEEQDEKIASTGPAKALCSSSPLKLLPKPRLEATLGAVNQGKYVYHFPIEGHYCCAVCGTPLFTCGAKLRGGGGFAAFSKYFTHCLSAEILFPTQGSLDGIGMRCVKCSTFVGTLSQSKEIFTGIVITVNSDSILYVQNSAPDEFLTTEGVYETDDFENPEMDFPDVMSSKRLLSGKEFIETRRQRVATWGQPKTSESSSESESEESS